MAGLRGGGRELKKGTDQVPSSSVFSDVILPRNYICDMHPKEETRLYFGLEHYIIDIFNKGGFNALRHVTIDNMPHNPALVLGEMSWEFLSQFRRDSKTGRIVADEYRPY